MAMELVVTVVEVMAARELAEAEVKAELVEVVTEGAAEAMMEVTVKAELVDLGLETRIWASRQGFGPQGRDLSLKTRI